MFVIYHAPPKVRPGQIVQIGGMRLQFEPHLTPGGGRVLAVEVPSDHPGLQALQLKVRAHPEFSLSDAELEPLVRPSDSREAQDRVSVVLAVRTLALNLGWEPADLEGCGQHGEAGDRGGRSPRTGMTLGEMALTSPPKGWKEVAHTTYPWFIPAWTPPHARWVAPQMPRKDGMPEPDLPPPPDPADTQIVGVPTEPEPDARGGGFPDLSELEPTPEPEPEPADPATEAGYPEEHVAQARALAHELAAKRGSAEYHPNALNFLLKQAGLPTVGKATLVGLLAVTP